jgi:hypothetical protein
LRRGDGLAPTVRVVGSAAGARRLMRAATSRPVDSTCTFTSVPGATTPKSTSGASPERRTVLRSTTDTIGTPGRTNAPGSMVRADTSPSNGARSTQSFTSRVVPSSFAFAAFTSALWALVAALRCSTSLVATKPPSSSPL